MEIQTIAVAIQMMKTYYIDDHNDWACKASATKVSVTHLKM